MKKFPYLNILLFVLTFVSTLIVGAMHEGVDIVAEPLKVYRGLPFSAALLLILLSHEFSHYIASKKHGIEASLPYFIPAPRPEPRLAGELSDLGVDLEENVLEQVGGFLGADHPHQQTIRRGMEHLIQDPSRFPAARLTAGHHPCHLRFLGTGRSIEARPLPALGSAFRLRMGHVGEILGPTATRLPRAARPILYRTRQKIAQIYRQEAAFWEQQYARFTQQIGLATEALA